MGGGGGEYPLNGGEVIEVSTQSDSGLVVKNRKMEVGGGGT